MAKKDDRTAALAERALERLAERRAAGAEYYPVPLSTLVREIISDEDSAQAAPLLRHRSFKQRTVLAHPVHPDAPIVLREDLQALADSDQLRDFALRMVSGPPPWLIADVARQVATSVRRPFTTVLRRQVEQGTQEKLVATPDERLAVRLVELVREHAASNSTELLTLAEVAQRLGMDPRREQSRLKRVAGRPAFASQIAALRDKSLDAPLAPADQLDRLIAAPESLTYLLRAARTTTRHLVTTAEAAKKAPAALRGRIERHWQQACEEGRLPAEVLAVRDGKKIKLLLIDDVEPLALRRRIEEALRGARSPSREASPSAAMAGDRPSAAPPVPHAGDARLASDSPPEEPSARFDTLFEQTFQRLNAAGGNYNQVSLAALREALSAWPRAEFDAQLFELRRQGRYTLSGIQNRFGVSEQERQAGIEEGGHLFLYVSQHR